MPDLAALLPYFADGRLAAAAAIALLAGTVRGFSGFGAALIYMPLMSALYDPITAVATIFLIDIVASTPFAIRAAPHCRWRDVLPLTIAASAAVPAGVALLRYLDATTMRWIIAVIVIGGLAALASGWRYHGQPKLPITIGVGSLAGLCGGAAQMSGPPVVVYWLGGAIPATVVRANIMVFFALNSVASGIAYFTTGLFTASILAISLVAGPAYALGMFAGAHLFHRASDATYRRVAYVIIALAAVVSLPLMDRLYR